MTVFDWHTGPYPARGRIALAKLNLQSQVRFVSVNLWKGEHKTPAFLAKNYSRTLPVLQLGGWDAHRGMHGHYRVSRRRRR